MSDFNIRIKELMQEKKLSQKELSRLSGVSEPSLCRYLRGDIKPRMDIVQNLAKALGVPAIYLIGESEYVPQDAVAEIKKIVARNRNIFTKQDKSNIIAILYGEDDAD